MTETNGTLETGQADATESPKQENLEEVAAACRGLLRKLKQVPIRSIYERPSINIVVDDDGFFVMWTVDCYGVKGLIASRYVSELWGKVDDLRNEFLKAMAEQQQG